jgi:amino acid permease
MLFRDIHKNGFDPDGKIVYFSHNVWDYLECFDMFCVSFFSQPITGMVSQEVKEPTRNKMLKLVNNCMLTTLAINIICGYCGYFLTFDKTDSTVFFYLDPNDKLVITGKISFILSLLLSNGIYTYVLEELLIEIFSVQGKNAVLARIFIGSIIFLFDCALNKNYLVFDFLVLLEIIAYMSLVFILPQIYYLISFKFKSILHSVNAILEIVIGAVVAVALLYTFICDYKEDYFS